MTWNGTTCSAYALWFWQARWTVDRDPKKQITLKEVDRNKNLSLPSKPCYPPSARP